jgi:hypothetical protein
VGRTHTVSRMERFQFSYAVHREDACHSKCGFRLSETLRFQNIETECSLMFLRVAAGAILAGGRDSGRTSRRPPYTAVALKCGE